LPSSDLFVGRQRELAFLRTRLEQLSRGAPHFVSVVGEAGIGKTALCSRVMSDADGLDVRTARSTALAGDGAPPYWLWMSLLRQLGIADKVNFDFAPDLLVDSLSRSRLEFAFYEDISGRIRALAAERPLLIVLEDLHWADDESLRLLAHFVSGIAGSAGIEGTGIGVVVSYRDQIDDPSSVKRRSLLDFSRVAGSATLKLESFSESETRELVESLKSEFGRGVSPTEVFERSGGNPLFVSELAQMSGVTDEIDHSGTVQLAVGERLDALSSVTVEILEICSLATETITAPFLLRLLEVLEPSYVSGDVHAALDEAVSAQFLVQDKSGEQSWSFRHIIVQEVVAGRIGQERRSEIHLAYSNVLETLFRNTIQVRSEEILFHIERAQPLVDDARRIRYLIFAARDAMKSLSFERAAARYSKVIELSEANVVGDSLAEAMRGIVIAGSGTGRDDDIAKYFSQAFRYYVSAGLIDLALEIAQIRFIDVAGMSAGIPVYESALELVETGSKIEANILGRLARSVGMVGGDYRRATDLLDRGVEIARSLGDVQLEMQLCGDGVNVAAFGGDFKTSVEYSGRVERLSSVTSDPLSESGAYLHIGVGAMATGDTQRAFEYLHRSLRRAIDSRVAERVSSSHKLLASSYIRVCDWKAASHHIESALEVYPSDVRILGLKTTVAGLNGSDEEFRSVLADFMAIPAAERDGSEGSTVRNLPAVYRVIPSDELLREIRRSIASIESRSNATELLRYAVVNARACLALEGFTDDYGELREGILAQGFPDLEMVLLPGISSLAGLVDDADAEFERMIAGAVKSGQLLNEVSLRYDFVAHLIRHAKGETVIARSIAQGRRVATKVGIGGVGAKYDRLEAENVNRRERTAGLTKRELEVLQLMYSGMSNPEIAEKLVVSRHTVVRHISNVFSKLEVSNRAEAGKAAVEMGLV
jgi:DNA-binding CsgD family transcriptional regulator/tetratricopeptide (TPR) repeat protein